MGRVLARIIDETPGCSVAGGLEPKGSALVGSAMGQATGSRHAAQNSYLA